MARAFLLSPEEVAQRLRQRYRNSRKTWLAGEGTWPLAIPLGIPRTEQEVIEHLDEVRRWHDTWRNAAADLEIAWESRKWRQVGTQRLPAQIRFPSPEAVVEFIGEDEAWRRAKSRYQEVTDHWPALAGILPSDFPVLSEWPDDEFKRLIALLQWLETHPESGVYIRQLPIPGVDSKWLESHRQLVERWLRVLKNAPNDRDFYRLTGLRPLPVLLRMRVLDPQLRRHVGGLEDITAPVEEFAQIGLPAKIIFIVENIQTGLAFHDLEGAVVFMGQGYAVEPFSRIPWLPHCRCYYWGDLDTHGFAILDRLRGYLPSIESFLMDEETLLGYSGLWTEENKPAAPESLQCLNEMESRVYQRLREHYWGMRIRLEQERIPWSYAEQQIKALADRHTVRQSDTTQDKLDV